jgi:phospholipase D1/2
VLVPGRNCWRIAQATRAAFLIDADAYFDAFRQVVSRARHSVLMVGWDVDSRVRLTRPGDGPPVTLLPFLNDLLERRPALRIYVLAWDFSMIFALERETLPAYRFAWSAHPRLAFHLDDAHPLGGSHHQKIVVADDRVAFAGGLDLTIRRWDTPAHDAHDADRVDPAGNPYPPMHDVQMMVEGDAAAALGALVRARWQAATGRALPAPAPDSAGDKPADKPGGGAGGRPPREPHDLWPASVPPDAIDVPVGIARTLPEMEGSPAVTEVAALTVEAIAAARRWLYVENQYLTSAAVGSALARSLSAREGPEIVLVLHREEHGWLEQSSMGILRARLLRRLLESDRHGRLRIFHPTVPNLASGCINVHAKVMIVDDTLGRVGSANLSNRSMGLDTECDLVLDGELEPRLRGVIADFRNRLLAEHLGVERQAVADALAAHGSLIAAVESLRGEGRSLQPIPHPDDAADADAAADGALAPEAAGVDPTGGERAAGVDLTFLDGLVCDPERPAPDKLLSVFVPEGLRRPVRRSLAGWALVLGALLAIAALWRFTPLRALLDLERIESLGRRLRAQPAAPLWLLGGYIAGGLVFFPITLLLGATAALFPPGAAILYSLAGTLASATVTYAIGRTVGRRRGGWVRNPRLRRFRRQLRERGMLAVVAARLLPVGSFSLVNITAGAFGIRFRDYLLGNALGVLPGVLALNLFADRLATTLRHPHAKNFIVLAAVAGTLFVVLSWLRRRLAGRR